MHQVKSERLNMRDLAESLGEDNMHACWTPLSGV